MSVKTQHPATNSWSDGNFSLFLAFLVIVSLISAINACKAEDPCVIARDGAWQIYKFKSQSAEIDYPASVRPRETLPLPQELLQQVSFPFEDQMTENRVLGFSIDVGFATNTEGLSSFDWARQHNDPGLTEDITVSTIGGTTAAVVRHTNLASPEITIYVSRPPSTAIINFIDVPAFGTLLSDTQKACWQSVLTRMTSSFVFK